MPTFTDGFNGNIAAPGKDQGYNATFQKHHLIPTNIANKPQFAALFNAVSGQGYDHNNFATSGMFLPNDIADSFSSGFARYSGSHPEYDALVGRVLTQIDTERSADINLRTTQGFSQVDAESWAAERAYHKVQGLTAYLKDGLVARVVEGADGSKYARPELMLNNADIFAEGRADVQARMTSIQVADVMNSASYLQGKAGTFAGHVTGAGDEYSGKGTRFDPFLKDANGHLLNGVQRVALRAAEFGSPLNSVSLAEILKMSFGSAAHFLKNSLKPGAPDYLALTVDGVVYTSKALEQGKTVEDVFADIKGYVESGALLKTGASIAAVTVGTFVASALLGTTGSVILVGASVVLGFHQIVESLEKLHNEIFPEWELLGTAVTVLKQVEAFVGQAANAIITPIMNAIMEVAQHIIYADGDGHTAGTETRDFEVGFDHAVIKGGGGKDWLVHFGSGEADGGDGNDTVVGDGLRWGRCQSLWRIGF
jgi:hypothetical protein